MREIKYSQSTTNPGSQPSLHSTAESAKEVAVTPTNGILYPTKHSIVVFKDPNNHQEKHEDRLISKNHMGRRKNSPIVSSSGGKTNGSTKGQKIKRIIQDKGSPFKVTSLKITLAESMANMVDLLHEQVKQSIFIKSNEEGDRNAESRNDTRLQN
ncbi:hypothetical protein PVK06_029652 [Gossypium arboreum]|uniref:Uncharacterized protein n=1 Tax=Gossypium arboreum TaxID=29729 RepID=A0ABR0NNL8_GOSAR|nr:hypothetical protein PVK06_029652 [Gossypium arboreum]